jgi:hypothetical protein
LENDLFEQPPNTTNLGPTNKNTLKKYLTFCHIFRLLKLLTNKLKKSLNFCQIFILLKLPTNISDFSENFSDLRLFVDRIEPWPLQTIVWSKLCAYMIVISSQKACIQMV